MYMELTSCSMLCWLLLTEKTFTNFAKCSKCFVISVARIISTIFCRTTLYVSLSKFLNMFTLSSPVQINSLKLDVIIRFSYSTNFLVSYNALKS